MPPRVLIVEDDKRVALELRDMLEFQGFDVRLAETGPDGVAEFERRPADVLVTALMLPDLSGLRVIERVRALPGGERIPVFLMSAVYRRAGMFASEMERLGVTGFLAKPFSPTQLTQEIFRLLEAEPEPAAAPPPLDTNTPEEPVRRVEPPFRPAPARQLGQEELADHLRGASWEEDSFVPVDAGRIVPDARTVDAGAWVRLLTTLFLSHSSGRLVYTQPDGDRTMYLLNGYPVWIGLSPGTPGLGAWLVDEQIITPGELILLRDHVRAKGVSTRAALVELQLVGTPDLPALLEGWVGAELDRAVGRVLAYSFTGGDEFAGALPVYEVNPMRALWGSIQKGRVDDLVRSELDSLADAWIERTSDFARLFSYIGTTPLLQDLGRRLAKPRQIATLRQEFPDPRGDVARCLWTLVQASLVVFADAPPSRVPPPAPTPFPSAAERPGRLREIETARVGRETVDKVRRAGARRKLGRKTWADRITEDYVSRIDLDHYSFLGVQPTATDAQLDRAFEQLGERYRADGSEPAVDTRRQAKELRARLDLAYSTLADPVARRRYDRELALRAEGFRTGEFDAVSGEFELPSIADLFEEADADPLGSAPPGDYPSAASIAAQADTARKLGTAGPRWLEARVRMQRDDLRGAYALLDELRSVLPSEPSILADLGWCRFSLARDTEDVERALEWAELGLAFRRDHADSAEVRARILCREDSDALPSEQQEALELVLRARPEADWARAALDERAAAEQDSKRSGLFGLFRGRK